MKSLQATVLTLLLTAAAAPLAAGINEWTRIGPVAGEGNIVDLVVDPQNPGVLYVSEYSAGVFKTRGSDGHWIHLGLRPAPYPNSDSLRGLAVDPVNPSRVYVGMVHALARSRDAGAHWSLLPGLTCTAVRWTEIDPRQPSTLYTGGDARGCSTNYCLAWKSTDRGSTWSCIATGGPGDFVTDFDVDPVTSSTLYAISSDFLHRSDDGGASWRQTSSQKLAPFTDLEIDPWNPAVLYTGVDGGIARSADRGQTWEIRNGGLPVGSVVQTIEIDPTRPTTLYAAVSTGIRNLAHRVYKSVDSGETWAPVGQGPGDDVNIWKLVLDPIDPSTLYIATARDGVMKLTQREPGDCRTDGTTLCLGDRFAVRVAWRDFQGLTGPGHARPLTQEAGAFWFFGDDNIELMVKALDGRGVNGRFWIFYGALTNVSYLVVVTDTVTGEVRTYFNRSGQFASRADTLAFPGVDGAFASGPLPGLEPPPGCAPHALCLGESGRFRVTVSWKDFAGNTGTGQAFPITTDSGAFWFFGSGNLELTVKILDGRAINNHYWFSYGALSTVEYTIVVTDTLTGRAMTYFNPSGHLGSSLDPHAFSGD